MKWFQRGADEKGKYLSLGHCKLRYRIEKNGLRKDVHLGKLTFPLPRRIALRSERKEYVKKLQNFQNREMYTSKEALKAYLIGEYEKKLHCLPDLDHPVKLTEKINWMKLHYQEPLVIRCCDKYEVKDYVRQVMGSDEYTPRMLAAWDNADDMDFDALPKAFALKVNWSSGYNIFVKDKDQLSRADKRHIQDQVRIWMRPESNSYYADFNWAYRTVKPMVIAEEFLPARFTVCEYKVFVFNGRAEFVLLEIQEPGKVAKRMCIDRNQQPTAFSIGEQPVVKQYPVTARFDDLLHIAERLGSPFPFVRVDFLTDDQRILVGEMTFYSGGGFSRIHPQEWDERIGRWMKLPAELL